MKQFNDIFTYFCTIQLTPLYRNVYVLRKFIHYFTYKLQSMCKIVKWKMGQFWAKHRPG